MDIFLLECKRPAHKCRPYVSIKRVSRFYPDSGFDGSFFPKPVNLKATLAQISEKSSRLGGHCVHLQNRRYRVQIAGRAEGLGLYKVQCCCQNLISIANVCI
jgi:hypothetical protein